MEEYRVTHPEFNDFIINEGYDWKTVVEDIIEDDKLLIYEFITVNIKANYIQVNF